MHRICLAIITELLDDPVHAIYDFLLQQLILRLLRSESNAGNHVLPVLALRIRHGFCSSQFTALQIPQHADDGRSTNVKSDTVSRAGNLRTKILRQLQKLRLPLACRLLKSVSEAAPALAAISDTLKHD